MLLFDIKNKNVNVKIKKINFEENFWKFGIFADSEIKVIKKIYGNVIINYKNHQYVIMKELAKQIEVEYA